MRRRDYSEEIRTLYRAGYSRNRVSKELHVSHEYVQRVIRNLEDEDKEAHNRNILVPYLIQYRVYNIETGDTADRRFRVEFSKRISDIIESEELTSEQKQRLIRLEASSVRRHYKESFKRPSGKQWRLIRNSVSLKRL